MANDKLVEEAPYHPGYEMAAMEEPMKITKITALSEEIRLKFTKQFPDLIDNHIAWMAFREGWQHGASAAYEEAYNLKEWKWE
jgi:hypothetical protein